MDDDFDLTSFAGRTRLFPLPGVVLFPHVVLPLHIFEPRYRQMTEHALASDRLVTIIQTRPDADWHGPAEPTLESVGCLGRIIRHERLADGRFNFLLRGLARVRLLGEPQVDTLYRQADVELLEEIDGSTNDSSHRLALMAAVRGRLGPAGAIGRELDRLLEHETSLGVVTDLVAHALGLPPSVKQRLLEDPDPGSRCDLLQRILAQFVPSQGRPRGFPPPFSIN